MDSRPESQQRQQLEKRWRRRQRQKQMKRWPARATLSSSVLPFCWSPYSGCLYHLPIVLSKGSTSCWGREEAFLPFCTDVVCWRSACDTVVLWNRKCDISHIFFSSLWNRHCGHDEAGLLRPCKRQQVEWVLAHSWHYFRGVYIWKTQSSCDISSF